ncbi:hypothetical protein CR513_31318, partial [Mucuna pruriens]
FLLVNLYYIKLREKGSQLNNLGFLVAWHMYMCQMHEGPSLITKAYLSVLGVSKESKGYKLYDPISKRVVVSRNVIFEEEKQ